MIGEMEERPPYVRFETKSVEDRAKTQETGRFASKDIIYVKVTPHGTRDEFEDVAKKWLEKQEVLANKGKIPSQYVDYYNRAYENYVKSNDTETLDGTPIKTWASLGPSDIQRCLNANILTVEDLAAAHDEGLHAIGMGARALKAKAQAWLASADTGKSAEKMLDLEAKNASLQEQNDKLTEMVERMAQRLDVLESPEQEEKPKRGRPAKAS